MLHATVNYLIQVAALAPSVTSVQVVGLAIGPQGSTRVVLSPDEYFVAAKGDFFPEIVQLVFDDIYPVCIMIGGETSVTVVEEAHHDDPLSEVSSRNFTHYDSPENIPLCFFYDFIDVPGSGR